MSQGGEPDWLKILRQRERSSGLFARSEGAEDSSAEEEAAPPTAATPPSPYPVAPPSPPAATEVPPAAEPPPPAARAPAAAPLDVSGLIASAGMPLVGGPGHTAEQRRHLRTRGVLLATNGLMLALGAILVLRILGLSSISNAEWLFAAVVTGVVQMLVWYVPHRYLDERIGWDQHYTYVPMLAGAALLTLYMYLAVEPVVRLLLLMSWFVGLLFTAGLAGFIEVTVLSGAMAAGYLVAARLLAARGLVPSFVFEVIVAGAFFGICVYAGMVFQRLLQERAEARDLRRELTEQALTDPLTGLPNRREFERIMVSELDRIRRYGGACTVAMIDVDYFKNYNDTLGHPAGDSLLRELASVITLQMRQSDFFARYGGEEFALVMVNTPGLDALGVMERLRIHIETHRFPDEEIQPAKSLTISAGLACFPDNGSTYEELIAHADEALYVAKSRGRNRVCGP
ncbi:MAG: GGDEF domain-containing protein [Gemmatimonadales bacterium]